MADPTIYENASDEQIALVKKKRASITRHTPNENTKKQQAEVCRLRLQGFNFTEIGEQMGIRPQHAHQLHQRAMKAIIQEPAQEVRELEVRRLDAMLADLHRDYQKFFPLVSAGQVVRDMEEDEHGNPIPKEDGSGRYRTYKLEDVGPRMQILDRMLKIQDRRAKLLGLDAPVRRTLEGPDGGPVAFDINTLRGLSDEELAVMVTLMEKATGENAAAPAPSNS